MKLGFPVLPRVGHVENFIFDNSELSVAESLVTRSWWLIKLLKCWELVDIDTYFN